MTELTKRQIEELLSIAGARQMSVQSWYYGKSNIVRRALREKQLIEWRPGEGVVLTQKGQETISEIRSMQLFHSGD